MKHGSDWYKRDPQSYLGGVQGLRAKEHAVYSVVLDLIYAHGGSVNNDPRWVAGWISDMGAAAVRKAIESLVERGKLMLEGDQISQKRAKAEAKTKETLKEIARKNGEKGGKKSAELRVENNKNNNLGEVPAKAESQADKIREDENIGGGGTRVHEGPHNSGWKLLDREILLTAIGADPVSGMVGPCGRAIGGISDMRIAEAWFDDLKLTQDEIVHVIREVMKSKFDGPPSTFKYFDKAMQRFAGIKIRPALTPHEGGQNERHIENRNLNAGRATGGVSAAGQAHQNLIGAFARAVSDQQ